MKIIAKILKILFLIYSNQNDNPIMIILIEKKQQPSTKLNPPPAEV